MTERRTSQREFMSKEPLEMRNILSIVFAALFAISARGEQMTLKAAYKDYFYIGSAFGNIIFQEEGLPTAKLISQQFNSISPCNELKWSSFHPSPDKYRFEPADEFVAFGEKNQMYVVGHVLFWHNQTPKLVFQDESGKTVTRKVLLERMRERVRVVAKRYKGKIDAWDVVNESIMDNGKLRDSEWTRIIGEDFIEQAFRIASEELPPDVELLYNDYSMTAPGRRSAVIRMIQRLKKQGIRIDGVGMQGHWSINGPTPNQIEQSIVAFSKAGVAVHITELDIDVLPRKNGMWGADVRVKLEGDPSMDPYQNGLPADMQKKLTARYAEIFRVFLKHSDKIKRVTFWGPTDRHSWLNGWPIKGRTNHPLLFDRNGKPKPAFEAVIALPDAQKK